MARNRSKTESKAQQGRALASIGDAVLGRFSPHLINEFLTRHTSLSAGTPPFLSGIISLDLKQRVDGIVLPRLAKNKGQKAGARGGGRSKNSDIRHMHRYHPILSDSPRYSYEFARFRPAFARNPDDNSRFHHEFERTLIFVSNH